MKPKTDRTTATLRECAAWHDEKATVAETQMALRATSDAWWDGYREVRDTHARFARACRRAARMNEVSRE